MSGETNLDILLRTLTATLDPETYVFATLPGGAAPAGLVPRMAFHVHSSLAAVGFIARIATELAREGMGVNPVSGFYHDHLFVPDGREDEALAILARIAAGA